MSLADYVVITIARDTAAITQPGFGTPLILGYTMTWNDRVRFYQDLPSMVTDGFAVSSPEYLAATAVFSQTPRPVQVAVGRGANKPTHIQVIGVASVVASTIYNVNVVCPGATSSTVTTATATYTSTGSPTNDAIVAGLVASLNLVANKNFTAVATGTAGSQVVTVTGSTPGAWFSLEVADVTLLTNKATTADPGVAADLTAITVAQPGWYGLHTSYNSQAYVTAAAAWIEANARIYVFSCCETAAITTTGGAGGSSDTLDALHTLNYTRTMGAYHSSPAAMLGAAWLGRMLPLDPGSATWKFKTLAGVAYTTFTSTQKTNLRSRQANGYENVAGLSITFEGTCADGEYLDAIVGDDWVTADMQTRVFNVLAQANKTEFEDSGVARVEAAVRATLKEAVDRKIYAKDPKPTVTAPLVSAISSANKATRTLPSVKWFATRSGAIHKVNVQGTVSL